MKKLLFQILFIITTLSLNATINCSIELIESVEAIQQTHKGKYLFESVESDGPLNIVYVHWPDHPFGALWNAEQRIIYINAVHSNNALSSIVFEMHNARTTQELEHYFDLAQNGTLSKEEFVEAVERMEHRNTLATAELLKEGIEMGLFPQDCYWPALQDFDAHYKIQQLFGHSQWIAVRYDETNPSGHLQVYQGTIDPRLYSQADKHDFAFYLGIRDHLVFDTEFKDQFLEKLEREYALVKACQVKTLSGKQCQRSDRKAELLENIFGEDFSKNPLLFAIARTND